MNYLISDNESPACAEVMQALTDANVGVATSYGGDDWSERLEHKLGELFDKELAVFPTVTGTASNALALAALTPSFGKVFCHTLSHINTDECGAPELFTGGAKLIDLCGTGIRLDARELDAAIRGRGNVHSAQPAAVSLTQSCETGTVYQLDEIGAIADIAHKHGLPVHMDGARFANALVSLGVSPAEMTWKSGVDVLTLGGTKNGCVAAEAVVFFSPERVGHFPYLHKRAGQLLSKMRFVSAQMLAYLSDDVWLRNARQANAMAARLSHALAALPGIELAYPTESNEVFVRLSAERIRRLRELGAVINDEELDGSAVRFVTAWNTQADEVDQLVTVLKRSYESDA